jgi:sugar phosphate isomerase/epimerase
MPPVRAFSTLGCPQATLEEALALALRYGLDGVELRALGGSADLPAYFSAQYGSPATLASQLGGRAARILAMSSSLRAIDGTAAARAKFLELVPWAEALGVRWLRVFDGGQAADDAEIARGAETVRWWRQLRAARGWRVDIMIETHDALITTPAIQRFLTASPEASILWDSHHTWRKAGEDPLVTWRALRSRIVHVHCKDSINAPSPRHPWTYVLPGKGAFPMEPLLAELRTRFSGVLSLEWEKLWNPGLPDLDEALRAAIDRHWL